MSINIVDLVWIVEESLFLIELNCEFEGRLFNYFDFKIMHDFGGSSVRLNDAYIDTHYFSFAGLNVGKQKQPIILERLQGDNDFTFLGASLPHVPGKQP